MEVELQNAMDYYCDVPITTLDGEHNIHQEHCGKLFAGGVEAALILLDNPQSNPYDFINADSNCGCQMQVLNLHHTVPPQQTLLDFQNDGNVVSILKKKDSTQPKTSTETGSVGLDMEVAETIDYDQMPPLTARPECLQSQPRRRSRGQRKAGARHSPDKKDPPITTASVEEARRQQFLARNRQAATKCRLKKKQWEDDLTERCLQLSAERKALIVAVAMLKNDVLSLKSMCLKHIYCGCDRIRSYLHSAEPSSRDNASSDEINKPFQKTTYTEIKRQQASLALSVRGTETIASSNTSEDKR